MKVSKSVTQENRAAVIAAASTAMRAEGVGVASMGAIAAKAGLTHGAIYRQFPSKSALASAVITHDFDHIITLLRADGMTFERYIDTYLSAQHRDYFPWGCPAGALAGEMNKLDSDVQTAFAEGMAQNIDALAALIPAQNARDLAVVVLATLIGALSLARAVKTANPDLSDTILAQTRASLLAAHRGDQRPTA